MCATQAVVKACSPTRAQGASPSLSAPPPWPPSWLASWLRTRTSDATRDCIGGGACAAAAAAAAAAMEAKPLRGDLMAALARLMLGRDEVPAAGAFSQ
jgi:hypothetical protein